MAFQKISTPPIDYELVGRINDGTSVTTDTTVWVDLSAGYPSGALAGTKIVPAKMLTFVLDITASANAGGTDATIVQALFTNAEDSSNPGQGDTGAIAVTRTLHTFAGSATANDYVGRHTWTVPNIQDPTGATGATAYRFVGFKIDFTNSAAATFGCFVTGGQIGVA